ncbi:hypothetical protein OQA88_2274 [Cercophora sp. LCS_1]
MDTAMDSDPELLVAVLDVVRPLDSELAARIQTLSLTAYVPYNAALLGEDFEAIMGLIEMIIPNASLADLVMHDLIANFRDTLIPPTFDASMNAQKHFLLYHSVRQQRATTLSAIAKYNARLDEISALPPAPHLHGELLHTLTRFDANEARLGYRGPQDGPGSSENISTEYHDANGVTIEYSTSLADSNSELSSGSGEEESEVEDDDEEMDEQVRLHPKGEEASEHIQGFPPGGMDKISSFAPDAET